MHESIKDTLVERLRGAYADVPIGSPADPAQLMGPLINGGAFDAMQAALDRARADGGRVTGGERQLAERYPNAWYVTPAIVEMPGQTEIVETETFAPILYVMGYAGLDQAIAMHNAVPQGLSSCIFTNDVREAEQFLSATGSDCGIANVNIGPSGAEIGGGLRRREGNRRRPRVRFRRLARLHASPDQHDQLLPRPAARPGHQLRRLTGRAAAARGARPPLPSLPGLYEARLVKVYRSKDGTLSEMARRGPRKLISGRV